MGEKPTAAFVLSLVGAVFILLNGLAVAAAFGISGSFIAMVPGMGWMSGVFIAVAVIAIIFAVIILYGAVMINSGEKGRVRTGSIIVLIFSIISLIGGGGFFIGFILCLIGSILGLTWTPSATEAPPPPP